MRLLGKALTFDDVLLVPAYSQVLPKDTSLATRFSRNIALNLRYLQRAGVNPAVAGGSVGLAQLAQFSSYFVLLLLSSVLAGTGQRASFTPPLPAVIGLIVVVALLLAPLAAPAGRRLALARLLPQ